MAKLRKELIEYIISESYEREHMTNFKQFSINNIISIPVEKPDIDELTKVWVNYEIFDYEFVETPIGTSCEGQILTGNKIFLNANLKVKFEYVSRKDGHSVHSSQSIIPICAYVTLQDDFSEFSDVLPSIAIEDTYCEQAGPRDIYMNIVLIAIVDVC